jgi:hypothetical protein
MGIGFYKQVGEIDANGEENNDVLTLTLSNNGFIHYYNSEGKLFVSFGENNN